MVKDYASHPSYDAAAPLLDVRGLDVTFETHRGDVPAVDGVDFALAPGETLCVLGESGSGKSVSQLAVMGLVPRPPGRVTGSARFHGIELNGADAGLLRSIRGSGIAMIFQDAIASLNPALSVGFQISEVYCECRGVSRREGRRWAIELMEKVAIPAARKRVDHYPHEFSGGMCQRIMIAMALALEPEILIADEPTTALDVTVQKQVMNLLARLRDELGLALILITHDLGVAAECADRMMVMYAGRVVETAPTDALFRTPDHPYTEGLLASMPSIAMSARRLGAIGGAPPVLAKLPAGCAFAPRCRHATIACRRERPSLRGVTEGRESACLRRGEIYGGGAAP